MKGADVEKAKVKVAEYQKLAAAQRNKELKHKIRKWPLEVGDLVLKYNVPRANDMSTRYKMTEKWDGPFRIIKHYPGANFYTLQEPGGEPLKKAVHRDHLRAAMDALSDSENDLHESDDDEEDLGALNLMLNPSRGLKMHFEVRLKGLLESEKATYELID
ncbi:hypothetical protein ACKAV7_012086 [Fusarium commune]